MRIALSALVATALVAASVPTFALDSEKGRIVRGHYLGSGSINTANINIRYINVKAAVSRNGQIRGSMQRVIRVGKKNVLQRTRVTIRGAVSGVSERGNSFTARAKWRLSDGSIVKGTFRGLSGNGQRLSRFFRGKFSGVESSHFNVRSR